MRNWVDIGVNPRDNDKEKLLQTAAELGYSSVGLEKAGSPIVETIKRVDLKPRTQNDLGKQLRALREKTELIVVHCNNKSVSRQAANDPRVDYLRFPLSGGKKLQRLDRQQAGLMKESGVGYELCIGDLLVDERHELVKRIGIIRRSLDLALKKDLPVVASSGARDQYGLRNPHGFIGLLSLLGVDEEKAAEMISNTPLDQVTLNREKLSVRFIEPGVWIVEP